MTLISFVLRRLAATIREVEKHPRGDAADGVPDPNDILTLLQEAIIKVRTYLDHSLIRNSNLVFKSDLVECGSFEANARIFFTAFPWNYNSQRVLEQSTAVHFNRRVNTRKW